MKTRNVRCASLAVLLTGGLALFTFAQEAKPLLRKPSRPLSLRSDRVRKAKQPRRIPVDQNRVHRFEELFDAADDPAVRPSVTKQVRSEEHTPGRFPGVESRPVQPVVQVSTTTPAPQVTSRSGGFANPFADDPEVVSDEVWQLSDIEPAMDDTSVGSVMAGQVQLQQTPVASGRVHQATSAGGDVVRSEPVRPVSEEREFARWQRAPGSSFENHGGGWVSWKPRTAIEPASSPVAAPKPKPKTLKNFRRGLLRPQEYLANRDRAFAPRSVPSISRGESHWASADKFQLTEPLESTTSPRKLVPVPTHRVSQSRDRVETDPIDDSWYDDFPDSKPRTSGSARTASMKRTVKVRPIRSRSSVWRKTASQKASR